MGLRDGGGLGQGRFLGQQWEEAPGFKLYNTNTNTDMEIEIQM